MAVPLAVPVALDDSYASPEDTALIVPALGVLDNDAEALTATLVTGPTHGSLTLNATGAFTYTPWPNFNGSDSFTYQATDGSTISNLATVTLTIEPVNDAPLVGAATVLYDGALNTGLPDTQGFLTYLFFPLVPPASAVQSFAGGVTTLDTTPDQDDYAGYFREETTGGGLNRLAGYTVRFTGQVDSEVHAGSDRNGDGLDDRAGFSLIVLSSDLQGIELGFWENKIWAQEGGLPVSSGGRLFTQAEGAAFDTTTGLIPYDLTVLGDSYTLTSGDTFILSGSLRDYTAFTGTFDLLYKTPNLIFLGDDTSAAQAEIKLAAVSVAVNAAPDPQGGLEDTDFSLTGLNLLDLDAGTGSVSATLQVLSGTLTASSTVTNGLTTPEIGSNGTAQITLAGPMNRINTTLAATNGLIYRGLTNFNGSDRLTLTITDNGQTGPGGALVDTKGMTITVSPVNDPPVAKADTTTATAGMPASISVLANDTDVDGPVLSVAGVDNPSNGSATTDGTTVVYTSALAFTGADIFSYTLTDGSLTDTAAVTVTVVASGIFERFVYLPVIQK